MDEAAFEQHPFSHGKNYPDWAAFQAEGSGAVVFTAGRLWLLHLQPCPGDIVIGTDSKNIREIVREMKKHIDD